MKTIKVIDLLNKIANGEEIPKFWWNGCIHQIEKDNNGKYSIFDTYCKKYKRIELEDLNEGIRIIEEPKEIEKPNSYEDFSSIDDYIEHLRDKIVELIDVVNKLKKEEK